MIFALALLVASSTASPPLISPDKLPPHLRPLAGATSVVAAGAGGDFGVHYELRACYPAAAQLDFLLKRVPREWVPRRESFLNPDIPTSQVHGWTHYQDVRSQPHTYVDQWSGEWDDKSGGILTYDLVIRSRTANVTGCNLEVSASQLSAATARALESSTRGRSGPVPPSEPAHTNRIRIVNPEFILLRALQSQSAPGATAASIYGKRVYYKSSERILDLVQLAPETAKIQQTPQGTFLIIIDTTTEGGKALRDWTSTHLNQQLGVFLDNRLVDAPVIKSSLDGMIVVDGEFTRAQAEEIKRRLLRGGAP